MLCLLHVPFAALVFCFWCSILYLCCFWFGLELGDVELCLNVPQIPLLALNVIIREDMQGLLYVHVLYIMYHFLMNR